MPISNVVAISNMAESERGNGYGEGRNLASEPVQQVPDVKTYEIFAAVNQQTVELGPIVPKSLV